MTNADFSTLARQLGRPVTKTVLAKGLRRISNMLGFAPEVSSWKIWLEAPLMQARRRSIGSESSVKPLASIRLVGAHRMRAVFPNGDNINASMLVDVGDDGEDKRSYNLIQSVTMIGGLLFWGVPASSNLPCSITDFSQKKQNPFDRSCRD